MMKLPGEETSRMSWLLIVRLLLLVLLLVMQLPAEETSRTSWRGGTASAILVFSGYPGEVQADLWTRGVWWACAML
eukprot:gene322-834_t